MMSEVQHTHVALIYPGGRIVCEGNINHFTGLQDTTRQWRWMATCAGPKDSYTPERQWINTDYVTRIQDATDEGWTRRTSE